MSSFQPTFILKFLFATLLAFPTFNLLAAEEHNHAPGEPHLALESSEESGVFKYVCPMHPQIVKGHEGTCPICGMDLVKQKFEFSNKAPTIQAGGGSEGMKQGFAIRTTEVQKTTLWQYIQTFGKVRVDETKVEHIHPRASGWISDLSVRNNGDAIKKGALLYRIYSPEIVSAQQDYLQALQNKKRLGASSQSVVNSAKARLTLLGLSNSIINLIAKRNRVIQNIPIYAPQTGIIGNMTVQNGMYVQPQTELMNITDLTAVWVVADILPLQQSWLKEGNTVEATARVYPSERWESAIDYIYPTVDPMTQALQVQIPLPNAELKLKPEMLMNIDIYGGPKRGVLAVPAEAVIDDGQIKRVVLQTDEGQFKVAEVVTGIETKGVIEIVAGLKENDRVVTSGQFLIDSESQIQTNLRRLLSEESTNRSAQ